MFWVLIYISTNFLAPIPLISLEIIDFLFQFPPNRRTARAEISRKSANRLKPALRPAKASHRLKPAQGRLKPVLLLVSPPARPAPAACLPPIAPAQAGPTSLLAPRSPPAHPRRRPTPPPLLASTLHLAPAQPCSLPHLELHAVT
jgi:hypothetical protein